MPDTPAIEVTRLVKSYAGVTAVNDISFRVARGEILGFLGPNGAGKSTTMRVLTGYLPATSGSVRICGVPVASQPDEVKRHIGYMPENNPLPEDMRVSEYLYFRGRLKELRRRMLGPRIDEVLELCDLKRVRHKIIGQLSKGYRQRVGIAEAVLAEPPVIIMDEPTIGLDPHQILIVRDLISSLRGRMPSWAIPIQSRVQMWEPPAKLGSLISTTTAAGPFGGPGSLPTPARPRSAPSAAASTLSWASIPAPNSPTSRSSPGMMMQAAT